MNAKLTNTKGDVIIADPPIAQLLFSNTKLAWLWAIVRLYLGYQWINAGYHKITGQGWLDGGAALKGFWTNAVKIPDTGKPAIAFDWYRSFIQFMLDNGWYSWFAPLVAFGETLIGVALIVGAFVGIAAFFGALLNWNFIMAGAASTNAVLFTLAILLIMAWKVAGWYGLDRFLLPIVGTPWTWNQQNTLPPNRPQPKPLG
ncbi:MAG TPA: DoxX family membrane protein [Kouleothrix sp.]|uniref:DoxX family membrane protein n=1 Tax=Kouleothrix sp. TaxID=2779161 RepID=UPI002B7B7AA7|nr:DoxX family membrane protein [Kouleothrix sp.]HRC76555.1 DoxX family membrane protein [Kouleothrix sp.]